MYTNKTSPKHIYTHTQKQTHRHIQGWEQTFHTRLPSLLMEDVTVDSFATLCISLFVFFVTDVFCNVFPDIGIILFAEISVGRTLVGVSECFDVRYEMIYRISTEVIKNNL